MNLIVQPKAGAAYLLTDTAQYDCDGRLVGFASKVFTVAVDDAFVAIATTGMDSRHEIVPRFEQLGARSIADLLPMIPELYRGAEAKLRLNLEGQPGPVCRYLSLGVAVFDRNAGKPSGYIISNDASPFPAGAYEPFTLQPMRKYLTRFVGRPIADGIDMSDPAQWNAHKDAEALIDAQRADPFGLAGNEHYGVGGQAILTIVSGLASNAGWSNHGRIESVGGSRLKLAA